MAKYRIFPIKDAFISTEKPLSNTGRDELLEVGGYPTSLTGQTNRTLIQFDTEEIKKLLTDVNIQMPVPIGDTDGYNFKANLNLQLNYANALPIGYTVNVHPLSQAWDEGTGKYGDTPANISGCSWSNRLSGTNHPWNTSETPVSITTTSGNGFTVDVMELYTTSSHAESTSGGGNWYFTSGSNSIPLSGSQSFNKNSSNDLEVDITRTIAYYMNNHLTNNGLIVKLEDSLEFNESASVNIKYYGEDTNTIYPPFLEIQWSDYSHNSTLSEVTDSDIVVSVKNNKGTYTDEGKQRFRLHVRPQNPPRTFTTSSAYLVNYTLPTSSYWGLRDENTEEMVFDYDKVYTKISADNNSNYFDIYMSGLQPERYYRLLVKTEIDGTTTVIDDNQIFKVVRNG